MAGVAGEHGHGVHKFGCGDKARPRTLVGEYGLKAEFIADIVSAKDNSSFLFSFGNLKLRVLFDAEIEQSAEMRRYVSFRFSLSGKAVNFFELSYLAFPPCPTLA